MSKLYIKKKSLYLYLTKCYWCKIFISARGTALLFSATYVSLAVFVHAAIDSDILDCSFMFGLFWSLFVCFIC